MKRILSCLVVLIMVLSFTGCSAFKSYLNDLKGQLTGNAFNCLFYDNYGEKFLTVSGTKIGLQSNIIREATVASSSGNVTSEYGLSSIVTINIDGDQIQSCGDTIIFEEKGLCSDADFTLLDNIESSADEYLTENTSVSGVINRYKNLFGKSRIVVIQSQMGNPICAYSGDEVYWEVREDLPKTTKLMIDGKALYIHRANFQIIDKDLL